VVAGCNSLKYYLLERQGMELPYRQLYFILTRMEKDSRRSDQLDRFRSIGQKWSWILVFGGVLVRSGQRHHLGNDIDMLDLPLYV
jgi:hypothetical protein